MSDQIPPGTGLRELLDSLGIRVGFLIAGFVGGIVSLQYLKGMSRTQTILALFSSLAIAAYGTPVLVVKFDMVNTAYQYGSAFILGLCALSIIPLIRSSIPAIWKTVAMKFGYGTADQPTQGDGGSK